jgi:hypothetical protein
MSKYLQQVAGGGIAWECRLFTACPTISALDLLDAAVDIAWERLMPNTLERPALDIRQYGNLIVFRLQRLDPNQVLHKAA